MKGHPLAFAVLVLLATMVMAHDETVAGSWLLKQASKEGAMMEGQLIPSAGRGFFAGKMNLEFRFNPTARKKVEFNEKVVEQMFPEHCVADDALDVLLDKHHYKMESATEAQLEAGERNGWNARKSALLPPGRVQARRGSIILSLDTSADLVFMKPTRITCSIPEAFKNYTTTGVLVSPSTFSFVVRPTHSNMMLVDSESGKLMKSYSEKDKVVMTGNNILRGSGSVSKTPIIDIEEFYVRKNGLNMTLALSNDAFLEDLDTIAKTIIDGFKCSPLPCLHRQAVRHHQPNETVAAQDVLDDVWQYGKETRPISSLLNAKEPILEPKHFSFSITHRRTLNIYVPQHELRQKGFDVKHSTELLRMYHDDLPESSATSLKRIAEAVEDGGYRIAFSHPKEVLAKNPVTVKGGDVILAGKGQALGMNIKPTTTHPSKVFVAAKKESGEWSAATDGPVTITEDCISGRDTSSSCGDSVLVMLFAQGGHKPHIFQPWDDCNREMRREGFRIIGSAAQTATNNATAANEYFSSQFVNEHAIFFPHPQGLTIGIHRQPLPFDIVAPLQVSVQVPNTVFQLFDEPWRQSSRLLITPSPGHVEVKATDDVIVVGSSVSDASLGETVELTVDVIGETLQTPLEVPLGFNPFGKAATPDCKLELSPHLADTLAACFSVSKLRTTRTSSGFSNLLRVRSDCTMVQWQAFRDEIRNRWAQPFESTEDRPMLCPIEPVNGTVDKVELRLFPDAGSLASQQQLSTYEGISLVVLLGAKEDNRGDGGEL